ncbi:MAG: serine hydrolase [Pseudomonadota bacterium]
MRQGESLSAHSSPDKADVYSQPDVVSASAWTREKRQQMKEMKRDLRTSGAVGQLLRVTSRASNGLASTDKPTCEDFCNPMTLRQRWKMVSAVLRRCVWMSAALLCCTFPAHVYADVPVNFAEKKAWLKSVEEADYLYWRRVVDRLELKDEWAPPASWYVPQVAIEGGEMGYFPAAKTIPASMQAAVQAAWDYALSRNSKALLIVHKGRSTAERYAPGYHRGSLLNARSMTKTLTAMLFGLAIEDGAVDSLDDPINRYIKEWENDPRGEISLRTYLRNASGLEFPTTADPGSKVSKLINGTHVNNVALSFALDPDLEGRFLQNNANTQVLGIALQRAVGASFHSYLSRKIWQPIGASLALMKQDRIGGETVTYCCLRSTAASWARIGQVFLTRGFTNTGEQVLPTGWVREMLMPSPANANYGQHIWRGTPYTAKRSYAPVFAWASVNSHSEPFLAKDLFYLDGGAKTRVWIIPSRQLVIVRMGDRPRKGVEFDDAFIPNTIMRGLADEWP